MKSLLAPWRYSYLVHEKPSVGCIFCHALEHADDADSLIVYRGLHTFVILNLYPYTNGHLMIVPNDHTPSPSGSSVEQRAELFELATACEVALRRTYKADGVNMGMNLGRAAGAGIEQHYHMHVLPRWDGDTNFLAVTAETRIIPEDFSTTRTRVREAILELLGTGKSGPRGD